MVVSKKLVRLIERNAEDLSNKWVDQITHREDAPTYANYDRQQLYKRAFSVYGQLGKWLSKDTRKSDIKRQYVALGKRRRKEGFAVSEVVQALTITRRILWFKVQSDGFLDTALDMKAAINLNNQVLTFFDRAIFFVCKGFEKN